MSFTILKERQKLNDLSLNGREASKSLVNKQLRPLLIVTKTTPARVKPGFHRSWISRSFATNLSKSRTQRDHNSVVNQPCRIHFKWDMFFVHRSYQRCKKCVKVTATKYFETVCHGFTGKTVSSKECLHSLRAVNLFKRWIKGVSF